MVKRILVTGAGGPAGINFAKSLRIAPEKMFLVGTEANHHYVYLAQTDKRYVVPKATTSGYLDELNAIISKEKVELVHAQPDTEVKVLSEKREKLKAATFLPSEITVRICQDKFESAKVWSKKGLSVPKTIELRGTADVEEAFEELGSPIWIRAKEGAGGTGSTRADNKKTAVSWIAYWRSRGEDWEFIAQEFCRGRNLAFHSLWKDGELVTSMARERLEYFYPNLAPSGITGTPSVQRTVHDTAVNKVGSEAVLAIDPKFSGIACVDLKENDEGTPCPTEINAGRMFTTSFFFSYASKKLHNNYFGNIPCLYVKLAFHEEIPAIPKYNVLPENIYWIRHIDAPAKMVSDSKIVGEMYH
jgi:predicted ATP-grasp superfamily ATP-dependent carboligase